MSNKKFSDLEKAANITDNDLFAVSSAKDDNSGFESNKVTFGQIKEKLDYDFSIVEVLEMTPPPESDDTVYISINGYRVAATRSKENIHAAYPTHISRITPVVSGFKAVKGKMYKIPFTTNNLDLSTVSVTADTGHFSTLEVVKIDNTSGYINLVTTANVGSEVQSTITLLDEASGISASVLVTHTRLLSGLSNLSTDISGNVITVSWRTQDIDNYPCFSAIEPKFTLSADVKHKIYFGSDYFNQVYIHRATYYNYSDLVATVILDEPFTGILTINMEDLIQGLSGLATVHVDYKG